MLGQMCKHTLREFTLELLIHLCWAGLHRRYFFIHQTAREYQKMNGHWSVQNRDKNGAQPRRERTV